MTYSCSLRLSALFLAASLAAACSSGTEPAASSTTGGDPRPHAEPPEAGPAKAADGTGSTTFAISRLLLGDTDLDGTPNALEAWKSYGFDLDGKISTSSSSDLCQPSADANTNAVYRDGIDGIDNAFGKSILPILRSIAPDFAARTNKALATGGSTLLFDLEKLGGGSAYNPLSGRLYVGTALAASPVYDGNDAWPVRSDLLTDPAEITSAKVRFPDGYVVDNTWVGRADGDIPLVLYGFQATPEMPVHLVIHHAVVTLALDAAHENVVHGTLAGILSPDALVAEIHRMTLELINNACTNNTVVSLASQVQRAPDILADGSQDPARTCDGISIGLGFEAKRVQLGAPTAPAAIDLLTPDPCP